MSEQFERLLQANIGLDAASIGSSAVRRAVAARMAAVGCDDADSYYVSLITSRDELQALIEAVVVPETWFFRDPQAFVTLARLAAEHAPRVRAMRRPLHLLSLPCSTGEEPYSMAMALLDAGLAPDSFRIDALDISGGALALARRAVYGRNSFRGGDLSFRSRHFSVTEGGYALSDDVKRLVAFRQGNLFAAGETAGPERYDIVLCRNLLIYFDLTDQRRAAGILRGLLAPSGVLFVGHSESAVLLGAGFASLRIPYAFAFRIAAAPSALPPAAPRPPAPPVPRPFLASPSPRLQVVEGHVQAAPAPESVVDASLEAARAAADRGDYAAARRLGETFLRRRPDSPEALRLMGVVSEASGELADAVRYYRKSLYLEPQDPEALAHLALLLDRRGDADGARLIRDRARRLPDRSGA